MQMVTDPPIGRDGRFLLHRARQFRRWHQRDYPLVYGADIRGAERAVSGGYAVYTGEGRHFVRLTVKGFRYLDALMRAE